MWKLIELNVRNIVAFREASFELAQDVATLIFGKNEDNASQPCNGSGKSSLIEAIAIGLTGEQLRKVKSIDEVINDQAEEAYVCLKLRNTYNGCTFTIERNLSRSNPQVIECHKYDETGKEIETDKTVQPTVSDYNRFILDEIGLTKNDIYSYFILCDSKYESFFDCSDRNKKEVINRFSNGEIVDESISKVRTDMDKLTPSLIEAKGKVSKIDGSILAIEEQLAEIESKKRQAATQRQASLDFYTNGIANCRKEIETYGVQEGRAIARIKDLESLAEVVKNLESSDKSLMECYEEIMTMCERYDLGSIVNYQEELEYLTGLLEKSKENASVLEKEVAEIVAECESLSNALADKEEALVRFSQEQNDATAKSRQQIKDLDEEIDRIDDSLDSLEKEKNDIQARMAKIFQEIRHKKIMLEGAVECPKCNHRFILDVKMSVEEVNENIDLLQDAESIAKESLSKVLDKFNKLNDEAGEKEQLVKSLQSEIKQSEKAVDERQRLVREYVAKVRVTEQKQASVQSKLDSASRDMERYAGRIDVLRSRMFGEVSGIIDGKLLNGKNYLNQLHASIAFSEGQMEQYRKSLQELKNQPEVDLSSSLKESLRKYREQQIEAEEQLCELQKQYDVLSAQETNFTMFKSYIARKKIDALSVIVNDFLEKIGSDIRLKLEGFTMTKTGKLRDKISVQVMRDGIDCGSFQKFSGGEKARLNLACILALHTLTNSNCDEGKGLDFLIIDELLDKSDEVGMATYCEALNKLGQTALLITQGNVAESYPHKLLVVKKQGFSSIII